MRLVRPLAALGALLSAAPLSAQEGEWIAQAPLQGFVQIYLPSTNEVSRTEYVPIGETGLRWTRKVTMEEIRGPVRRQGARAFAEQTAAALTAACPGTRVGTIDALTVSTYRAVRVRVDCPRHSRTGLPETFFLLAVNGSDELRTLQIAFRRTPTEADLAFAERQLASVEFCHIGYWPDICHTRPVPPEPPRP